jgi:hypothetical protein
VRKRERIEYLAWKEVIFKYLECVDVVVFITRCDEIILGLGSKGN